MDWDERAARAIERYEAGTERDLDQRQLTQLGNAAWAAGLSLLMAGRREESAVWLRRAASRYRASWQEGAPESSPSRRRGACSRGASSPAARCPSRRNR